MTSKDVTTVKEVHGMLKGAGLWVDVKRFVKSNKQFNPAGLFKLFGSYSDQSADEVRDCFIGWIYDNYNSVKGWLRMAVKHKNIELNDWIEKMLSTLHMVTTWYCTYSVKCTTNMHMSIQPGMGGAHYLLRLKPRSWKLRPNVTLNLCYCIAGCLVRC